MVTSQPRVTGFLGGKGRPIPITEREAERLIRQMSEGVERPRTTVTFEIGEQVRVSDGPFASFNGLVEEADDDKARLKVAVSMFGRSTPVELEYSQVETLKDPGHRRLWPKKIQLVCVKQAKGMSGKIKRWRRKLRDTSS